jgi:hypothetical protein
MKKGKLFVQESILNPRSRYCGVQKALTIGLILAILVSDPDGGGAVRHLRHGRALRLGG